MPTAPSTPPGWTPYPVRPDSTVVGTLLVGPDLGAPGIARRRPLVLLPPSYRSGGRSYPVLYMQDGNNLFDEPVSHSGEWRVDETMAMLAAEGIEAIIVGIPNAGDDRAAEYGPWEGPFGSGIGDDYLRFVIDVVKSHVDSTLRTVPGKAGTGIMGSSLGGFISLYGLFAHPDTFGFAGAMSPALWWSTRFIPWLEEAPFVDGRIYIDVGTREIEKDSAKSAGYVRGYESAVAVLRNKGYDETAMLAVVEEGATHRESAWARRLPDALRFLLPADDHTPPTTH